MQECLQDALLTGRSRSFDDALEPGIARPEGPLHPFLVALLAAASFDSTTVDTVRGTVRGTVRDTTREARRFPPVDGPAAEIAVRIA